MEFIPYEMFYTVFSHCEPCSRLMLYYTCKHTNRLISTSIQCIDTLNEFRFRPDYLTHLYMHIPQIFSYILQATKNGDLNVIEYIRKLDKYSLKGSKLLVCIAARYNHRYIIEWSIKNNYHKSYEHIVEHAIAGGDVELTKWLIDDLEYPWSKNRALNAIGVIGSKDIILYAINNLGIEFNDAIPEKLAQYGHLETLKWIDDNDYKYDHEYIVNVATKHRYYDIVKYIHSKGYYFNINEVSIGVCNKGDLDMLKWLEHHKCCSCNLAFSHDNTLEHNKSCEINRDPIDETCIREAATYNHYHIVDWIIENISYSHIELLNGLVIGGDIDKFKQYIKHAKCEWNNDIFYILADSNNSSEFKIAILEYAIEQGYKIPNNICDDFSHSLDIFKWLLQKGFKYNSETIYYLVSNEYLDIIKWLYDNNYKLYDIYNSIITNGEKSMIEWLLDTKYVRNIVCEDVYDSTHDYELVELLYKKGYDITVLVDDIIDRKDTDTMEYFASIATELDRSIYEKICVGNSFRQHGKYCVKFVKALSDNGLCMSKRLVNKIIRNLPKKYNEKYLFKILTICKENGCRINEKTCKIAEKRGHSKVARWLERYL